MSSLPPEAIVAIATAVGGLLSGGFLVALLNRRKTRAEAKGVEISGHMEIVNRTLDWNKQLLEERDKLITRIETIEKNLNARLEKLEKEIEALEEDNRKLRKRCQTLEYEKEQMSKRLKNLDSLEAE